MDQQHKETEVNKPAKKNYIKKALKVLLYIVIALIVLPVILYGVLSIPSVQEKLTDFALKELRKTLKTEVRIDEARFELFNHVSLRGVYVEDMSKDTLVYAGNLDVSISPWSLFKNKLLINEITLEDVTARLSQQTSGADFNFQFIVDAFSSKDTTAVDTTKSSLIIDIVDVTLKNAKFRYDILSDTVTPGVFNASHIHVSDLNAELKLPSINSDNLDITLVSLALKEQSGIEIKELKAHLTSDKDTYYLTDASLNLPNSVLKIPSAHYNTSTSDVALTTEQSKLSKLDLYPFMPSLKHLQHDVILETTIKGKLPLVNIENLLFSYGDDTNIKASGSISNYHHYDEADLRLDITNLKVTQDAIVDFARLGDSTFVSPDILKTLGDIRLVGNLHGKLSDLNIKAEAWAKQGSLQLVATGAVDTTFQNYNVKGGLQTQNFNLGGLLANPDLGRLSANVNLTLKSVKQSLSVDAKGQVNTLQYRRHDYNNIPFTAFYNPAKMGAWLKADLPAGKLEAKADMTQERIPKINVDMAVEDLQLDRFIDSLQWQNPHLSFKMKGNIVGLDPAKVQADVVIDDFKFSRDSISFIPGQMELKAGADQSKKYINLNTSFLTASIEGEYNFRTLSDEISVIMNRYMPGVFPPPKSNRLRSMQNDFTFKMAVNNTENLSRAFDLPANIIEPMIISGMVNTKENKWKALADAPLIEYGDLSFRNTRVDIGNTDTLVNMLASTVLKESSGRRLKLALNTGIKSDTINAFLTAKTDTGKLNVDGSIKLLANLRTTKTGELASYVHLLPTDINVGKLKMSFMNSEIKNDGTKTSISNFGFIVGNNATKNRFLGINGVISNQKTDTLDVSFSNADLGEVLEAFDIPDINAVANGDIKVMNVLGRPELYTNNLSLSNIVVFNDSLGDLTINSNWSEQAGAIRLQADLQKVNSKSQLEGWLYPVQDSLNLKLNLDRLDFGWVQPFVPDLLNKASGTLSSGLNIKGRISKPLIDGWLGVNDAYLGIDYTNVTYHISDTIQIEPNKIGFDNLVLEDSYKNKATLNALLTHKNFENMQYTLDLKMNNLLVLNTANRTDSLYYGKVFANGTVNIKGADDLIDMKVKITPGRNSMLNVLLPQTSEATVYESIVYINVPEKDKVQEIVEELPKTLPLHLSADLTVTPDFQVGVVINPATGDAMQVKGSGLIKFSYDMQSQIMNAFGDYTVSDGWVSLKLQNIKKLDLKIKEGSKLVFNGDPLKTSFNITAYKRVKTDLKTLDSSFDSDDSNTKVFADCELIIKGNMDKMDVSYNIVFPDASDDVKQKVNSLISTNEQKTVQFAYLLATGSFHSSGTAVGGNMADGLLTSVASTALSKGLNVLFGSALGDKWTIGTNISSNDGTFTDMDMTVSLSRKFLEDKLEFNTDLGYRTDQSKSSKSDNSFIGDFNITYALNKSIKLKAFNKTNDQLYEQAPTTQGVGIVYTKEAKRLKDLFSIFKKRKKRSGKEVSTENSGK